MFSRMNPTLRGFLIVALIALVVVILNLYVALASLFVLARIAFFLAIAFFVYLLWRERREDIEMWPRRAKVAFYGAALLIVVALGAFFLGGASGPDALAFLLVLAIAGFAMWRTWRDQHTYG
jgi:drug/metabolite transporter (DMT)-like permease